MTYSSLDYTWKFLSKGSKNTSPYPFDPPWGCPIGTSMLVISPLKCLQISCLWMLLHTDSTEAKYTMTRRYQIYFADLPVWIFWNTFTLLHWWWYWILRLVYGDYFSKLAKCSSDDPLEFFMKEGAMTGIDALQQYLILMFFSPFSGRALTVSELLLHPHFICKDKNNPQFLQNEIIWKE